MKLKMKLKTYRNYNQNISFLNDIYKNALMGRATIPSLLVITKDVPFRVALDTQLKEYQKICTLTRKLLRNRNQSPTPLPMRARICSLTMTKLQTMFDSSTSHIAEMMIQGNTMGVISITRNIKENKDCDKEIKKLAQKLLKTEQDNIEQMKAFL